MINKPVTASLLQLKQYEETLQRAIDYDSWLISEFDLEEDSRIVERLKTFQELLNYIQNDIKAVEEYEEQLEIYRKQLEQEK